MADHRDRIGLPQRQNRDVAREDLLDLFVRSAALGTVDPRPSKLKEAIELWVTVTPTIRALAIRAGDSRGIEKPTQDVGLEHFGNLQKRELEPTLVQIGDQGRSLGRAHVDLDSDLPEHRCDRPCNRLPRPIGSRPQDQTHSRIRAGRIGKSR